MTTMAGLEDILRRDRLWVLGTLAALTLVAWAYLVAWAAGMDAGAAMEMRPWTPGYAFMMFIMWAIMMVGMMLPSATPVMLLHARVCRRRLGRVAHTGAFLCGYLVVWTIFSAGATALQWVLAELALLSPAMTATSPAFGATVLVAAGLYQFTSWKHACLAHCRSPIDFLARRWRQRTTGAMSMGIEHGAYCVGCCWLLMAILFVAGIMDLLWIAAITAFVLVEKAAPAGRHLTRFGAVGLILAGIAMAVTA
ncbi:DUF2182 domain-containing protein [Halofilum ochraceum]|uniref:DUF2182 domain-containing protein n=1 Tax=Halofilum ochraceum TaxID=1611323 RepID=UPI0008D9B2E1|nr:DUF2182 domain-containing protein [Halofilum ochraceum]